MTSKKLIILGHTGFIGASFFRHMSRKIGTDVLGFSSESLDLRFPDSVEKLSRHCSPDTAVAFFSAITRDRKNDAESELHNLQMVENVLSAIKKSGSSHLIFSSSIDVYGLVTEDNLVHENTPLRPDSGYASYKVKAETLLRESLKNTPLTILRWGGIYGPHDTHRSPIKIFISSILRDENIFVYFQGKPLRDYVFIDDLCNILEKTFYDRITGCVNVVSGQSVSILEILTMLQDILQEPAKIQMKDGGEKVSSYRFDASLFRQKYPGIILRDLRAGLKETSEFMSLKKA